MTTPELVTLRRTTWNRLMTGRPQGDYGKADYTKDEPSFMSYYCRPDQFEEIQADAGVTFSDEHKAACVLLEEIERRVEEANPDDPLLDDESPDISITVRDFEALRELARVADEAEGLSLSSVLSEG